MMTEDEDDAAMHLFHAAAHAVHSDAEAAAAKGEGLYALMTGVGVGAALLGGAFFIAAKEGASTREAALIAASATSTPAPAPASAPASGVVTEQEFVSRPEFKSAEYQGRLIADAGGLRFDTGTSAFALAKYDAASGRMVPDRDATLNVARFSGDLAFCRSIPGSGLLKCWALHHGVVIDLDQSESVKP